jgi:phospholipase/carboxylesterase
MQSSLGLHHRVQPPRAAASPPYPAVVLLHGRGADETDLLALADALDPHLFVVSVRAPLPLAPGFEWYRLESIGSAEPVSFRAGLGALQAFIDDLPRVYPIDPQRIVTLGFSQGAVMAGTLLLTRPAAVAATVMLSGYLPLDQGLPVDEAALAGRPVFVAHGTADPLIPVSWARVVRDYLERRRTDLTYREYPIGHAIGPEELADVASWIAGRV